MSSPQPGILAPVPPQARYLTLHLRPDGDPRAALARLAAEPYGASLVVGIGPTTATALGVEVPGLRPSPTLVGPGSAFPSTPAALWLWLRGDDRGVLLHRSRALLRALEGGFGDPEILDAYFHDGGRDLSGYEDGTENPRDDEALAAALVAAGEPGLSDSSFVGVQRWHHDLDRLAAFEPAERDHIIGRRREDNEELADAPPSAHIQRTAQEDFEPAAFVVRRSMPWTEGASAGLVFVAFGRSLDAYEALMRRMIGGDDGIVDALFRFTQPRSGATFWCPPCAGGRLDLSRLGISPAS
ncbi:MAG: Dyp-type peroxidase [Nannocystaceae bacterium]